MSLGDFLEAFESRIKSPLFGSFSLSFLGFNWRELFFLFFNKNANVLERIGYFDANTDYLSLLVGPLILAGILAVGMPYLNLLFATLAAHPKNKRTELNHKSRLAVAQSLKSTLEAEDKADEEGFKLRKSQRLKEEEADIAEHETRRIQRAETEKADIEVKKNDAQARLNAANDEIIKEVEARQNAANDEIIEIDNKLEAHRKEVESEISELNERLATSKKEIEKLKTEIHEIPQTKLSPIPRISKELKAESEEIALDTLKVGKIIPKSIGLNIRKIGTPSNPISIAKFSLLKNCTYLEYAYLSGSTATDFNNLTEHKYIRHLVLTRTKLQDLTPLTRLTRLSLLYIAQTKVTDISPLSKMKKLKLLDLRHLQITDISPLAELNNLNQVFAEHLEITDWSPLDHIKNVRGRPKTGKRDPKTA